MPLRNWCYPFALVLVLALAGSTVVRAQPIAILEQGFNPTTGSTYLLLDQANWTACQAMAEALGGDLVTVDDAVESQWIKDTFADPPRDVWIGLNDQDVEGTFEWVSGQTSTFTDWAPGEPNDGGSGQDFAYYWAASGLQWDDVQDAGAGDNFGLVEIEPCGVDAPTDLAATSVGADVELAFVNNGPYPGGIDVYRDGIYHDTIVDPAATDYTDLAVCGGTHAYLLRALDGAGCGNFSEIITVGHGVTAHASATAPIPIPDADPIGITDSIDFVDSLIILDLDVAVEITHTWTRDLDVVVNSPASTNVTLKEYTPGTVTDYNNLYAVFDDQGAPYDEGLLPLGIHVQPEGPGAMADFNGEDTQGFWTLAVSDNQAPDIGTLDGWTVIHNDWGLCPITAPIDLTATVGGTDVDLAWDNDGNTYTRVQIIRDGVVIDTLTGSPDSYADLGVGVGLYDYAVRGIDDGVTPCCAATTDAVRAVVDIDDLVWQGEHIEGDVDSAIALFDALTAAGRSPVLVTNLLDCECTTSLNPQANIWAMLGTYPADHWLTAEEADLLVAHLSAGGNVFIEGGDAWGFATATSFRDYDGVDGLAADGQIIPDGDDSFVGMIGLEFEGLDLQGLDAAYDQDSTASDWTDRLIPTGSPFGSGSGIDLPGPLAGEIWIDSGAGGGSGYTTAVYYLTDDPYGNVIAQSWEFGGYGGDQALLAELYVEALASSGSVLPEFRRGDANGDGGFDISDAVFSLAALFTPGAPSPECVDAADSNDDGVFDISDAVYSLGALFVPGAPPPPPPGSSSCGPDPTDDGLDCAVTPCP